MTTKSPTARSYDAERPNTFSQIVGNEQEVQRITSMLDRNRLPNVIFLWGPTGSGKTTTARIIARAKLCQNRPVGRHEPCGECSACCCVLNDTNCNMTEYHEYDANGVTESTLDDLSLILLRPWEVIFIDELQDMDPRVLKQLRKPLESAIATVILTTTHPDEIEDAFRNRLKSYEYEMARPRVEQTVDYLERRFHQSGILFESRSQLVRVAEALNCEMRPCGEFPRKLLAESGSNLTNEYLDNVFGPELVTTVKQQSRRRNLI
jgi:DNA polymerase-3 subunit gamma/tau